MCSLLLTQVWTFLRFDSNCFDISAFKSLYLSCHYDKPFPFLLDKIIYYVLKCGAWTHCCGGVINPGSCHSNPPISRAELVTAWRSQTDRFDFYKAFLSFHLGEVEVNLVGSQHFTVPPSCVTSCPSAFLQV